MDMVRPKDTFFDNEGEEHDKADQGLFNKAWKVDKAESRAREMRLRGKVSSLCGRCTHCTVIWRSAKNDPTILCHVIGDITGPVPVPHDIVECSSFNPQGTITIEKLAGMAVDFNPNKKKVGFIPPKNEKPNDNA